MTYRTFFVAAVMAACLMPSLSACKPNTAQGSQNPPTAQTPTQATSQANTNKDPTTSDGKVQDALPDDGSLTSQIGKTLQANLNRTGIKAQVLSVHSTEMSDVYLVNLDNTQPIYTDKTGTYVMQGSLISLAGDKAVNLTDKAAANHAKALLGAVRAEDMIVYSPKGTPKAAVYVFTDPTCHYCQLLHKDINQINSLGIEVRYLAWPRGEQTIPLTEAIWCSSDRKQALTDAKLGRMPNPISCQNPVREQVALGFTLGVTGTPAIFTQSGEQIGGYVPADELAQLAIAKQ